MANSSKSKKAILAMSALAVAATLALPAAAGQCPAGQAGRDVRTTGEMSPLNVTDNELSGIDLGKEIEGFDGRRLRFRKLVVQPGGVVPWHDHTDRPALIYTAEGEITEFRSDCKVGVVHHAGDISTETAGLKHWWKNESKAPAVLFAADIKNGE
jgi:quercetin dioxygenase-like cupin family protein